MDLSAESQQRYDAVVAAAGEGVVCLDFDGVLAPIVEDPTRAHIHPEAGEVLVGLAAPFRAVAVVTGRPAAQAVELGDLEAVGARVTDAGGDLRVLGQYGNESWSAASAEVVSPPPPPGLAAFTRELPALLDREGLAEAWVERKGLAVAVHTRRLPDPRAAYERLLPVLRDAAGRHGLGVEPGRMVVEVRGPGSDKGAAVRRLHAELAARAVVFAGDDLGDVPGFEAVTELRERGTAGFLVCSGSEEQRALVELADVVVGGPDGVMAFLRRLAADARGR